jgi:hypothetical protein
MALEVVATEMSREEKEKMVGGSNVRIEKIEK